MWSDLPIEVLMRTMVHIGQGDDAKLAFHSGCTRVCKIWLKATKLLMRSWHNSSYFTDTMAAFPSPHQIGKRLLKDGKMEVGLFAQEPLRIKLAPAPSVPDGEWFPTLPCRAPASPAYSPTSPAYSP